MIKIMMGILAIGFVIGVILVTAAVISIEKAAKSREISPDTPAIVLGCKVNGETPSRILSERIDAAYDYLQSHEAAVAVLSGGKGEDESISEAECMRRMLISKGIAESRLLVEDASVNTQTNLENSKKLLEETNGESVHEIVLITSEFHEYRAGFHARGLGMKPKAYASKTAMPYKVPFYFREIVAVVYTWFFRR